MLDIKDARDNRLYRVLNYSAIEQQKTLESPSKTSSTIVFIDSGVDDYQSLVDGAVPEAEVIVLDSAQDGIEQITKVLQGRTEIAAIHIISHGSPGCLYLGNSQLSLDTLNHYAAQIKSWIPSTSVTQEGKSASIPILLYGCNVAAGDAGEEFLARLGQLTGANIAASAKRTGSAALGGDWKLELTTSNIEVPLAFPAAARAAYGSVLATPKGQWIAQGPSPATGGQVENVTPNNEVAGAIHTVLAHPENADILYIGTVNGGIWKTTNATDSSPNWTPLTDNLPGNSIGAMEFDPIDKSNQTIVAGIGRFSSFSQRGGPLTGLIKTTNGGKTWTQLGTSDNLDNDNDGLVDEPDETLLSEENISGVASRGNSILVSTSKVIDRFNNIFIGGVYRSIDSGATWKLLDGMNGLPTGAAFDLVGDPTDNERFYVSVQGQGIFRSDNGGASWIDISSGDTALNTAITTITPAQRGIDNNNTEMAVASNGRLYAAVLSDGQPSYIGYINNPTATNPTWTEMDLPVTQERDRDFEGLSPRQKPGGQGNIHFSIIADPNNPNTVYIGGDRQDGPFRDAMGNVVGNAIGANDFSGRLFRGDTTQAPRTDTSPGSTTNINSPQWQPLTHGPGGFSGGGTVNNSAPHADSREMTFDANSNLIEVDDGGIYRRTSPQNADGDWFSINGNLQITEIYNIAYDPVSNIIISGNQDTGTTQQTMPSSGIWDSVALADGGDVAIDATSIKDVSIRYSSRQEFGGFKREFYDKDNTKLDNEEIPMTVTGAGGANLRSTGFDSTLRFRNVHPFELNTVNPKRMLIGTNFLYESTDQADNLNSLAGLTDLNSDGIDNDNDMMIDEGDEFTVINSGNLGTITAIAYGGKRDGNPNEEVAYVGSTQGIRVRTETNNEDLTDFTRSTYFGSTPRDIVLDPDDWMTAFAIDSNQVFQTTNANTWTDITDNLFTDFSDGFDLDFQSIEFIPLPGLDSLVVGTNRGIFASNEGSGFSNWSKVGIGLPNVPVWDLDYDLTDNVLVAGTLGRGAWLIENANEVLIPSITVDILTDEDDGNLNPGDVSLREAIRFTKPGGTINFNPNLAGGTIGLTLGELVIDKDLTINGLGADQLTISGKNASRVFNIDDGNDDQARVRIDGLTIANGNSSDKGGGIRNNEKLFLINTTLDKNTASSSGGGIFNSGDLTVTTSTISNNTTVTERGGGLSNLGVLVVNSSTINNNSAPLGGGGISSGRTEGSVGRLTILNSTLSNNQGGFEGGGILNNVTSNLTVTSSTIHKNSADEGSGIFLSTFTTGPIKGTLADATIRNTIVAGNTGSPDVFGNFTGDHNLIGTDPKLGPLQDNGGPTFTHALLEDSPAIDAGTGGTGVDQRGVLRPQGDGVDIGAFEALPFQITVTTLKDEVNLSDNEISLREAVQFSSPGATINFASNLIYADAGFGEGTIGLQLGELVINKDLTINGLGADKLTISGNNASRIFNIDDGNNSNLMDINISGLTIADGNANFGGGIFNQEELLISNSTIRDNTAQFSGGGIFSGGRLNIENSTISGNTAERSSGGGIDGSDFLSIANVTISGNQAGNNGGGISFGQASGGDTLIVNSSTITQNTTNGNGGGIFSRLADSSDDLISINNTIIAQNFDNNTSDGNSPDVWGEFSSNNRFNLIGDLGDNTSSTDFLTTEGNQVGTNTNPIDAMLGDLQNNGGPTFTHAPLPGSPVLDAANPLANVTVDQRGMSRPQGKGFDIGAVEGELNPITIQPTDRRFFVGTRLGDRIVGDARNNNIGGAAGNDVIFGGAGNDHLSGHGGNNFLFGEDDDDRLWGGQMDDFLDGGDGSDRLFGQNGNDTLLGGQGIDLLEGGKGSDKMTGGEGKDIFQIRQSDFLGGTFVDQILDFNAAEGDRLRLVDISIDEVMFNTIGSGDLELTFSFGGKVTLSGITNDVTFVATNVDFDATRLGNISPLA
ncbi:MAG: DUF4347 domain-containing protein [Symploca sp. SIO2C1]|nr:DUF4347 domain-containing protein [Symploca sp. SIO2C1]